MAEEARVRRLVDAWKQQLSAAGNKQEAVAMAKYMKGVAPYFGIKSVERRAIAKACLREVEAQAKAQRQQGQRPEGAGSVATRKRTVGASGAAKLQDSWDFCARVLDVCLGEEQRELHYCGVDLVTGKGVKRAIAAMTTVQAETHIGGALKRWISTKPWWDTVDLIASHVAGAFFQHHPEATKKHMTEWLAPHNPIWQRRTAILCQLSLNSSTDQAFLFHACRASLGTDEFFINKVCLKPIAEGASLRTQRLLSGNINCAVLCCAVP